MTEEGCHHSPRVLVAVAEAYRDRRDEITQSSARILNAISSQSRGPDEHRARSHNQCFTRRTGMSRLNSTGKTAVSGSSQSFPSRCCTSFFLTHSALQNNDPAGEFAELTLTKMARGGIYDQIGGGFHRYSVDSVWLVPHFEKMLYDNGQLASLYLHAWQRSGEPLFAKIVEETLNYLDREMGHAPTGAFYSATDADSEGEEGKFFVWQTPEIEKILGDGLAKVATNLLGCDSFRQFRGAKHFLHAPFG